MKVKIFHVLSLVTITCLCIISWFIPVMVYILVFMLVFLEFIEYNIRRVIYFKYGKIKHLRWFQRKLLKILYNEVTV